MENTYTIKQKNGTTFKYQGTEESAKMLASSGGATILELPNFIPYTAEEINAKTGQPPITPTPETTDMTWLTNDSDFKSLTPDMQEYLISYYDVVKKSDEEAQKKLNDALEEAKTEANAYFKEAIRIAQDELTRNLGEQQADYDTQEKTLTTKISQLEQDLRTAKSDLSIDEQADLAKQIRNYKSELGTLRENAAAGGMTFSSKRAAAENLLATENEAIVESTKTKYMREIRDLEIAAARGEQEAINTLADYKRQLGENMTSTLRSAESKLGTSNLPDISQWGQNAKILGDVTGTLEEEKTKDILERANALTSLNNL